MKNKTTKQATPQKQASCWIDIHYAKNGEMTVGIETDDKSLTFDGYFMCLIPARSKDEDFADVMLRAREMLKYLRGEKQMRRL